ncbi:hypothetical protein EDB86DRAFT_3143518 [Lactarius hatsudake]|nr:hypothetical protein EDB86DRAFT_3143518 [Lactarius hatsudake]
MGYIPGKSGGKGAIDSRGKGDAKTRREEFRVREVQRARKSERVALKNRLGQKPWVLREFGAGKPFPEEAISVHLKTLGMTDFSIPKAPGSGSHAGRGIDRSPRVSNIHILPAALPQRQFLRRHKAKPLVASPTKVAVGCLLVLLHLLDRGLGTLGTVKLGNCDMLFHLGFKPSQTMMTVPTESPLPTAHVLPTTTKQGTSPTPPQAKQATNYHHHPTKPSPAASAPNTTLVPSDNSEDDDNGDSNTTPNDNDNNSDATDNATDIGGNATVVTEYSGLDS